MEDSMGSESGSSSLPATLQLAQLISQRLSTQALGLGLSGSRTYLISHLTFFSWFSSLQLQFPHLGKWGKICPHSEGKWDNVAVSHGTVVRSQESLSNQQIALINLSELHPVIICKIGIFKTLGTTVWYSIKVYCFGSWQHLYLVIKLSRFQLIFSASLWKVKSLDTSEF